MTEPDDEPALDLDAMTDDEIRARFPDPTSAELIRAERGLPGRPAPT